MDQGVLPELPGYLFDPSLSGVLSLLVTVILPVLAALLIKRSWSTSTKGLVLLGLAAVKTYAETLIANGATNLWDWNLFYATVINAGIATVAYLQLWKGSQVQQAALDTGVRDPGPDTVEGDWSYDTPDAEPDSRGEGG